MLQLINIEKKYTTGDLTQAALNGVSLNLRDSEFVAILGPSGSGKTTLLNIIGGLDMKQTAEEAARGYSNDCRNRQRHCEPYCIVDFISGAEWQSKQSPWISVKERLPENNTVVLTRGAYGFLICQLSSLGEC